MSVQQTLSLSCKLSANHPNLSIRLLHAYVEPDRSMPIDLSPYTVEIGDVADPDGFDAMVQTIENAMNAVGDPGLMAFTPGQIISWLQFAQSGAATGQAPMWDGASYTPAAISLPTHYQLTLTTVISDDSSLRICSTGRSRSQRTCSPRPGASASAPAATT